jgi:hypothetical protein
MKSTLLMSRGTRIVLLSLLFMCASLASGLLAQVTGTGNPGDRSTATPTLNGSRLAPSPQESWLDTFVAKSAHAEDTCGGSVQPPPSVDCALWPTPTPTPLPGQ